MSAEGVSFDVLKKLLFEWFPEELNRNPKFHRLDTIDESKIPFVEEEKQDFNCNCCERSYSYKQYGCTRALGRWCAIQSINNIIHEDIIKMRHFYDIHKKLEDEGRDLPLNSDCLSILRKYVKIEKAPKLDGLTFYTIVPKERLPFDVDQIDKLKAFCYKEFTGRNFERCKWIIEAGKHKENPNLHIHCIGKLRNKNFKREFIGHWNKSYDKKYNISYEEFEIINGKKVITNAGWDKKPCNTLEIQKDKLDYLNNLLKGDHENFIDLGIGESFGFEG